MTHGRRFGGEGYFVVTAHHTESGLIQFIATNVQKPMVQYKNALKLAEISALCPAYTGGASGLDSACAILADMADIVEKQLVFADGEYIFIDRQRSPLKAEHFYVMVCDHVAALVAFEDWLQRTVDVCMLTAQGPVLLCILLPA